MSYQDAAGPGGSVACQASSDGARYEERVTRSAHPAADDRQRIERDIHDGVQQRLTALRIRMTMAADHFGALGDHDARTTLLDFGAQVEQAIDELREVARGIYPALLASDGLAAALTAAAKRAAHPVTVATEGIGRYSREVESAIYFSVSAALDNAARYAGDGPVAVTVWEADQRLHFTVADGGHGFEVNGSPVGGGLANMRERIAAVNGTFKVESSRSDGTRITGTVPEVPQPTTPRNSG
jgi:signal transduction histidine kinase